MLTGPKGCPRRSATTLSEVNPRLACPPSSLKVFIDFLRHRPGMGQHPCCSGIAYLALSPMAAFHRWQAERSSTLLSRDLSQRHGDRRPSGKELGDAFPLCLPEGG